MSGWALFDYDRFTGLRTALRRDDDKIIARHYEDVEPVIERNKRLQNDDTRYKRQKKAGFVHVASIPATVQIEWINKYGVNIHNKQQTKEVMALLNKPEYRYLKTTTKRI